MDTFVNITWEVAGALGIGILLLGYFLWSHLRDCQGFRKSVRDKDVELLERLLKLEGKVDTITAILKRLENGRS